MKILQHSTNIKITLFGLLIIISTCSPLSASADTISDLQNKRDELSKQAQVDQQQAKEKSQEITNLSSQIDKLDSSISETEQKIQTVSGQIDDNQKSKDQISAEIAQKQSELAQAQSDQSETLVSMYEGQRSVAPFYVFLTSATLTQLVTYSSYLEAITNKINDNIQKINTIKDSLNQSKKQLEDKENELQSLQSEQVSYQDGLEGQKEQQSTIRDLTETEKQNLENSASQKMQQVSAINEAIIKALNEAAKASSNLHRGGTGGYPYYDEPEPFSEDICAGNMMTSFCKRNCTDYVAWKWSALGYPADKLYGAGNANTWASYAQSNGLTVSSEPKIGAAIVWNMGTYGHVAYVENVNSDGSFDISQYNIDLDGTYSIDHFTSISKAYPGLGTPQFIYPN